MRMMNYLGAGLALACMVAPLSGANAQADGPLSTYQAMGRATPQCPVMTWYMHRDQASSAVTGVVWFMDMSGISSARGTVGADGKVAVTLTPIQGSGPSGTVTGIRGSDGSLDVSVNGSGCSNVHIKRMPMSNMTPEGSG